MDQLLLERQKALEHLNNIITTQASLAGANFDVNAFMNLVAEQIQQLTPATGVVVELVEAGPVEKLAQDP